MSKDDRSTQDEWMRTVLDQFEVRLLRYAVQITGDLERARDVVQDTLLRLCREDPAELDGHLAQWLFTVCRNRALDVRRKEQRMTTTSEHVHRQVSTEISQVDQAEQEETKHHVLQLVADLPDSQREIVRLRFQNGLSYREIAGVMGITVSNVGNQLHTAIRKLQRRMAEGNA